MLNKKTTLCELADGKLLKMVSGGDSTKVSGTAGVSENGGGHMSFSVSHETNDGTRASATAGVNNRDGAYAEVKVEKEL